jgi:hypothetical protein
MNCPTCGAVNQPGAAFCSQCATNLLVPPGMGAPPPPPPMGGYGYGQDPSFYAPVATRTSGMAIAGFVLSFFCALLGLIFSCIGYSECKRSNGSVTGEGLAIAGIVISILMFLINIVWIASMRHNRW